MRSSSSAYSAPPVSRSSRHVSCSQVTGSLAEAQPDDLPLVFVPDSEVLRSPTTLDLAAALGLRTRALQLALPHLVTHFPLLRS